MSKLIHEIRDPIHNFIYLEEQERQILDSPFLQRLRHIHQLGMTYLLYPGATHKRFEHSLGVMELATRIFNVITNPNNLSAVESLNNLSDEVKEVLGLLRDRKQEGYWKGVVRMAALCHDLGHLPFSHAAEKELLPEGWDHERITREIIESDVMKEIWKGLTPPLREKDIVKVALGPKKARDLKFSPMEKILSDIIVSDFFGADRMDYLLRDSHHLGVAYGKFDHYRLIDTMRILPSDDSKESKPMLGVEEGGLHSAEALMLARYFMYKQVYLHPIRRVYDIHLKDFLKEWLEGGFFSTELSRHQKITDNEIIVALLEAAKDENKKGHIHARRIIKRKHFKVIYSPPPEDLNINREPGEALFNALIEKFSINDFRHDRYRQEGEDLDFPVLMRDGSIDLARNISELFEKVPPLSIDYVFTNQELYDEAEEWLEHNKQRIIKQKKGEEDEPDEEHE